MGIEGEERFLHRGISYCALCDGHLYKDKVVACIGGGNSALEESLYLATLAKKVYVIHRRNQFRADAVLIEQVKAKENITCLTPFIPLAIRGEGKVESILLQQSETGEEKSIEVSGIFPYIGYEPTTQFLMDAVEKNEAGYLKVNAQLMTSCKGLFACGDVIDKSLRQIVTAVSDGAIASQSIQHYLRTN